MRIDKIIPPEELSAAVVDKLVRVQTLEDDSGVYQIHNYTERATFTRSWNTATRNSRGLIIDMISGEVLARPWPKFFNYAEHDAGALDLSAPVEVTDKLDGSLGILWFDNDGMPRIATRGSFTSEQALHATALYQDQYAGEWNPDRGLTYLFEIIYPGNRIVIDYGDMNDLVLLGAVSIDTGVTYGPASGVTESWPGPRARVLEYATLGDALLAEPRANAEGIVVRFVDGDWDDTLVKIKQDDYVALHRLVTGLTTRRLWERLAVHDLEGDIPIKRIGMSLKMDVNDVNAIIDADDPNTWLEDLIARSPEEFAEWIRTSVRSLEAARESVERSARALRDHLSHVPRELVAARINDRALRAMVFALLDGKPIRHMAWREIRPDAERAFRAVSEDVA